MKKEEPKNKLKKVRLSKNIVPTEYDIRLHPDLENFTFAGEETIRLTLTKSIKSITLHSKDIDIETASITAGRQKVFADRISYNSKAETATFTFKKSIPAGRVKLTLSFRGILNDKMRGFYRSSYIFEGKVHNIATTQFEATDARRAFPCFDEPAQKSIFHVSLVVPKGKSAISNTLPVSRIEHEAGFEVIKFAPSPKMSTYLLAFIVGDFEYIEKKSKRGVLVRVYTSKGKVHQAKFALDVTAKVLDFYEEYFDIPYPLDTLDSIAIPDFSSLAMENWGAITYREIGLLVDENNTSMIAKERIVEVIAHELSHQWFGNLVTMEWWTHLWLNEGFASYIPYVATHELFPTWDVWTRFSNETASVAIKLDSLKSTHPIEVAVHHPDQISEIFDAISYRKGASVIRMLAEYLGERDFREGLRYYLKKHSYRNTETIHLWEAFERVSRKPVSKMMKIWTSKSGYPFISAELSDDGKHLELRQERFFASLISQKNTKDMTIWPTPITVDVEGREIKILMDKKTARIPLPKQPHNALPAYIKLNQHEHGFYRVNYSEELLELLFEKIKNKELSVVDRLGVIRDLFALAESGHISTIVCLRFLSAFKEEDHFTVWSEISAGLMRIEQLIAGTSTEASFNKFIIELYTPAFRKLGWDKVKNEEYLDAMLRSLVIARLGGAGHKEIITEAKSRFAKYLKGLPIHPDIRGAIYQVVAKNGGEKEYRVFLNNYKNEDMHEEKNRLGSVLGYFQSEKILKNVCDFAISPDVRQQDMYSILAVVAINPFGRNIWIDFINKNWDLLLTKYGDGGSTISYVIKSIWNTGDRKHFIFLKKFFSTHQAPGADRAVQQVLERIENNVLWLKRDGKKIAKFLQNLDK